MPNAGAHRERNLQEVAVANAVVEAISPHGVRRARADADADLVPDLDFVEGVEGERKSPFESGGEAPGLSPSTGSTTTATTDSVDIVGSDDDDDYMLTPRQMRAMGLQQDGNPSPVPRLLKKNRGTSQRAMFTSADNDQLPTRAKSATAPGEHHTPLADGGAPSFMSFQVESEHEKRAQKKSQRKAIGRGKTLGSDVLGSIVDTRPDLHTVRCVQGLSEEQIAVSPFFPPPCVVLLAWFVFCKLPFVVVVLCGLIF
jgi:hypothetical protein